MWLAHEVKTGGQLGAQKMLHKIKRWYFRPHMKEDVQQMILSHKREQMRDRIR